MLDDQARTLLPETPQGPYGFVIWGLPVAWQDPVFEITAASWVPARGKAKGRGLDLIAWAALPPFAVDSTLGDLRRAGRRPQVRRESNA